MQPQGRHTDGPCGTTLRAGLATPATRPAPITNRTLDVRLSSPATDPSWRRNRRHHGIPPTSLCRRCNPVMAHHTDRHLCLDNAIDHRKRHRYLCMHATPQQRRVRLFKQGSHLLTLEHVGAAITHRFWRTVSGRPIWIAGRRVHGRLLSRRAGDIRGLPTRQTHPPAITAILLKPADLYSTGLPGQTCYLGHHTLLPL